MDIHFLILIYLEKSESWNKKLNDQTQETGFNCFFPQFKKDFEVSSIKKRDAKGNLKSAAASKQPFWTPDVLKPSTSPFNLPQQ